MELARETLSDYWTSKEAKNIYGFFSWPLFNGPELSFCFRCSISISVTQSLSMVLGGLTTWLLLQRKSEVKNDYENSSCGKLQISHVSTIVKYIQDVIIKLVFRKHKIPNVQEYIALPSPWKIGINSSQSSFDDSSFVPGQSKNYSGQGAECCSEVSSPREETNPIGEPGHQQLCLSNLEHRAQLIDAIMLGDEAFVASALAHIDDSTLEEHGRDEYGNSFLILAVQVRPPKLPCIWPSPHLRPTPAIMSLVVATSSDAISSVPVSPRPRAPPSGRPGRHRGPPPSPQRRRRRPELPRPHRPPLPRGLSAWN